MPNVRHLAQRGSATDGRRLAGALLALSLAVTACSAGTDQHDAAPETASDSTHDTLTDSQARDALLQHIAGRISSASVDMGHAQTLRDILPNRRYRHDEQSEPIPYADAVVLGKVIDAAPGAGFVHPNDDPEGVEVAFDDPDALWRTVEATVEVRQGWGQVGSGPIKVGIVVSGGGITPAEAVQGVKALGQVFLALGAPGSFLTYNENLYSVGASGAWLGLVEDGKLRLPTMEEPEQFLDSIRTIRELREEAAKPDEVIDANG